MREKKIVAVSGGFDPVHVGHIRMLREAKLHGDELVVILNNDDWLMKKKGFIFMSEDERKEVLESLKWVDRVIFSLHPQDPEDMSVSTELKLLHPSVFANGGDRDGANVPEMDICEQLGIEMVFGIGQGGKVQSSSDLVKRVIENHRQEIAAV